MTLPFVGASGSRYPDWEPSRTRRRGSSWAAQFGPRKLARNMLLFAAAVFVLIIMVVNRDTTTIQKEIDAQAELDRLMAIDKIGEAARAEALERQSKPLHNANEKAIEETYGLGSMSTKKGYNAARPNEKKQQVGKEKAALVVLARNDEIQGVLSAMKQIESAFNREYHYPWVFLNQDPFDDDFITFTTSLASGEVKYGLIPPEQWSVPEHIDKEKMDTALKRMAEHGVIYGENVNYRHMCRFNSGFFWRQEALDEYDWYWRVETGTHFYCDLTYDPFTFMRENNKKYGFTMAVHEYLETVETLWPTTQAFLKEYPEFLSANASLSFLTDEEDLEGKTMHDVPYNLCHFWSNFEIGSLEFYRSPAYRKYFEYLDNAGGFYYERWGDAPVHSLAVALLLGKEELHWFADIGYNHIPWSRFPQDDESYTRGRCIIPKERSESFDDDPYSCIPRWKKLMGLNKFGKPEPQP